MKDGENKHFRDTLKFISPTEEGIIFESCSNKRRYIMPTKSLCVMLNSAIIIKGVVMAEWSLIELNGKEYILFLRSV